MAHEFPAVHPTPTRPSLSPLAVKDCSGAARSTTLTEATELYGGRAAYSFPRPRRAFSDEVVVLASTTAAGSPVRRKDSFFEDWWVSVSLPVYDLDSCVEQLGVSPRSPSDTVGSLFSGSRSVRAPFLPVRGDVQRNPSFGQVEAAHSLALDRLSSSFPFDAGDDERARFDVEVDFTDSFAPGGLDIDVSVRRGRRASRVEETERMRQSSVAKTAASRRVLSVGKTGPSLALHTESAVSSPSTPSSGELAFANSSSLQGTTTRSRSATVLSDSAAMSRRRSNASESLARFVSDSPTSPVSPPRQPSRPLNRRRHSSYTRLADHGDDSRTVTASLKPDPDPSASSSPSRNSPTLTSSLSRYLSSSRRGSQSVWAQTSATGSGTTTPAALAKDRDLRKPPPSGPLQALTSSLAFLPAFPFPGQKPAETASYAKGEGQMRVVPWSSIKALYVCFKPSSASLAASNAGEDEDTATSDIVNAWLVGLQELSAGGSRPWDPRLLCPEPPSPPLSDSSLPSPPPLSPPSTASAPSLISSSPSSSEDTPPHASPRKRRRPDWPTVTMLVSVPPAVWVERRDGGWREFDPKGMGVEEIMRNVLLVPSTAASTASTRFPLPSFLGHQSQPRITHQ